MWHRTFVGVAATLFVAAAVLMSCPVPALAQDSSEAELRSPRSEVELRTPRFSTTPRLPVTDDEKTAVLAQALRDFEEAAAMKRHAAGDARALYESALAGFQSLVDGGVLNGRLYYNLANTHLRLGQVGRAIVNYRRALRLMPGDAQVRGNLEFARKLCEARIRKPAANAMVETLLFWHFGTSASSRARAALAAYACFWTLALAARFLPRRIPALTWLTVAVLAFTLVVGASATWDHLHADARTGVLITDDVTLRKGGGDYYDPQLEQPLPQGVEFDLIDSRIDVEGRTWHLIRLGDGKEGWLRGDQVELV